MLDPILRSLNQSLDLTTQQPEFDGSITFYHMSSVQNPSIIPLYWMVYRDSPFGLIYIIPNILGSIIPELIINQPEF